MSVAEIQGRIASIQATFAAVAPFAGVATASASVRAGRAASASTTPAASGPAPASFATALGQAEASATTPDWASRLPAAARRWVPEIERAAEAAGVDPRLVAAVAWTESGFDADAVSGAGARGLMQLMPATARGLGVDPASPSQNLAGGARYLAEQLDRFGNVELALAAYNAGPGAVVRHGGVPPYSETRTYVTRVLERLRTL